MYQYDKYNDTYRYVPLNGSVAGVTAATEANRDAWYSPAGFTRGVLTNVSDLSIYPKLKERDQLFIIDLSIVSLLEEKFNDDIDQVINYEEVFNEVKKIISTDLRPTSFLCIGYPMKKRGPKTRRKLKDLIHVV